MTHTQVDLGSDTVCVADRRFDTVDIQTTVTRTSTTRGGLLTAGERSAGTDGDRCGIVDIAQRESVVTVHRSPDVARELDGEISWVCGKAVDWHVSNWFVGEVGAYYTAAGWHDAGAVPVVLGVLASHGTVVVFPGGLSLTHTVAQVDGGDTCGGPEVFGGSVSATDVCRGGLGYQRSVGVTVESCGQTLDRRTLWKTGALEGFGGSKRRKQR